MYMLLAWFKGREIILRISQDYSLSEDWFYKDTTGAEIRQSKIWARYFISLGKQDTVEDHHLHSTNQQNVSQSKNIWNISDQG
jgi:hypothetical protein